MLSPLKVEGARRWTIRVRKESVQSLPAEAMTEPFSHHYCEKNITEAVSRSNIEYQESYFDE